MKRSIKQRFGIWKAVFFVTSIILCTTILFCIFLHKQSDYHPSVLPTNLDDYYSSIDYSCLEDSDCVIKDVHNCCGYYPKCVNKNAKTNPSLVRKLCSVQKEFSSCGFAFIERCACVNNRCIGI